MYILIDFPTVQEFQEFDGFEDNSHPAIDIDGAVFIDVEWLMNVMDNIEFKNIIKDEIKNSFSFKQKDKDYVKKEWERSIPFEGGMSTMEALIHITNL